MIGIAILFFITGLFMLMGKGSFLVAGYNTMSEERQKQYNMKRITQAVGVIAILTSIFILVTEYMHVTSGWVTALFVIVVLGNVIFINMHPYFKNSVEKN
ncbi:DUF3784 domain-containing protein [Macrococcus brunensis]|uniref:DUF3784 domain-containing protein n=1 Tax=Macrococcus brunensis TaxID=198483 RepID=UPI001EF08F0D|nr:DUF3784 domain-containing protein [Macrococcus brunensis]ULG72260.1 DUF3784 domain-containing protein [Macrococcus brunensis]